MRIGDIKEIKDRIKEIKRLDGKGGDPEVAHAKEDDLYKDFVKLVANTAGDEPLGLMAKEVLKSKIAKYTA